MPDDPADIRVRPITPAPADVEALRALRIEALRLHPTALTADLGEAERRPLDEWRRQAEAAGGDGTTVIFRAEGEPAGDLAGMAGVYTPPQPKLAHSAIVWGVYVRAAHRGQGVGTRLVRACVDWARAKGYVGMKLSAVQDNAAIRCYERCGFVTYGVEPFAVRWEGKLYDEVLMALRL